MSTFRSTVLCMLAHEDISQRRRAPTLKFRCLLMFWVVLRKICNDLAFDDNVIFVDASRAFLIIQVGTRSEDELYIVNSTPAA